jgi:hypothetical protein
MAKGLRLSCSRESDALELANRVYTIHEVPDVWGSTKTRPHQSPTLPLSPSEAKVKVNNVIRLSLHLHMHMLENCIELHFLAWMLLSNLSSIFWTFCSTDDHKFVAFFSFTAAL